MTRRGKIATGLAGVAAGAALFVPMLSSPGSIDVFVGSTPTPTSTPPTVTCNQTAANSTQLATAVSAATTGQTVCLTASVSYGAWAGTNKAITLYPITGTGGTITSPTMTLNITSGSNFTIDGGMSRWDQASGLRLNGGTVTGITNVTFKNFQSSGAGRLWVFSPGPAANSNDTIDHAYFHDCLSGEANLYFDHSPVEPVDTGFVVKNSYFGHMSCDGIKLANDAAIHIVNNKFHDFFEANGGANHTDEVQFFNGDLSVLRGNWFDDCEQAIFSGDPDLNQNVVEHNVVSNCNTHWITMEYDKTPGSIVRFNTIVDAAPVGSIDPSITCGDETGGATVSKTSIYDNVARNIALTGGGATCVPTRNDHNMVNSGATGTNFNGTTTFVGGASPGTFTSFAQFCLAPGTSGITQADDGGQVGVCGGDYNATTDGPPTGQGF